MIPVILVDDESRSIEVLSSIIKKHCPTINIMGEFTTIDSAYEFISKHEVQLVFLDVDMSPYTGFDLLKKFTKPHFEVIFVTAYDHYAIDAIRFSALYYLLKPVNVLELKEAIVRAEERIQRNELSDISLLQKIGDKENIKRIVLNSQKSSEIVDLDEILYLEAENAYTFFHLINGHKIFCSKNLAEYEKMLTQKGFYRIHKSYIVNLAQIASIDKTHGMEIILKNKTKLPLATRRKEQFLEVFKM